MKKLIIILTLFLITSCNYQVALVKPYTIVSKRPYVWHDNQVTLYLQEYTYQDSLGTLYYFFEKDIYNVGDTIK